MPRMTFNQEIKDVLDSLLLENPEVEPGKAFGLPAYYVNGKMFACVYEDGATIKVPTELAAELLEREDVFPFEPMKNRVMKNWVLIKHTDPDDFLSEGALFADSMSYVFELSKRKK